MVLQLKSGESYHLHLSCARSSKPPELTPLDLRIWGTNSSAASVSVRVHSAFLSALKGPGIEESQSRVGANSKQPFFDMGIEADDSGTSSPQHCAPAQAETLS